MVDRSVLPAKETPPMESFRILQLLCDLMRLALPACISLVSTTFDLTSIVWVLGEEHLPLFVQYFLRSDGRY